MREREREKENGRRGNNKSEGILARLCLADKKGCPCRPANGINLRAKFASMRIRSACISRQAHISLPRDPACVHARTHARTRRECEDAGSHEFRYRGLGKSISMSLSAALLKATACSENKKELRLPSSTQA
jgi:hypothetical protein